MTPTLAELTAGFFEPYQGQEFLLLAEEPDTRAEPVECELIEVQRGPGGLAGKRPPFSLLLRGSHGRPLARGLHTLRHEGFQIENLFINRVQLSRPRTGETGSAYYEAVFG